MKYHGFFVFNYYKTFVKFDEKGGVSMFLADGWKDYELIDCSNGEKLEYWGGHILRRPDPQIVWELPENEKSDR